MSGGAGSAAGDELDAVAGWVQRLGALLAAGLEPMAALPVIESPPPELAAAADCDSPFDVPPRLVAAAGASPPAARRAWGILAAAWSVALDSGAPLAVTLERS